MSKPNLKVRAHASDWNARVDFLVLEGTAYGKNIVMESPDREPPYIEPTFSLSMNEAQTLMDDLWIAGLRPTEGSGSAGSLAATQRHLEDMRKLVFLDKGIKND